MYKNIYRFIAAFILGLLLALTLVSCAESNIVSPATTAPEQVTTNPVAAQTTVIEALPTLATTAATAPTIAAKATPAITSVNTTIAAATTTAPVTVANEQEVPPEALPPLPNLPLPKLAELPRLNGVPKIPVLNSNRAAGQPNPVIKANYGLNGSPRIGVQIGHYQIDQLPDEQASLRAQTGGNGGGVREVDLNMEIARKVAALLAARGATVDLLPATVPVAYSADAFIAIHADAAPAGNPSGYKLARSRFSAIPQTDDALLSYLYDSYGKATGLATDSGITRNMTGYYAFNNRRRVASVSKVTPAAIIEMGFLTNASDRAVLLNRQDAIAKGIAEGIWQFIENRPPLDLREKPQSQVPAIEVVSDNIPVYGDTGGLIAYVSKGQRFEYFEDKGDSYSAFIPLLGRSGFIRKSDVIKTTSPR